MRDITMCHPRLQELAAGWQKECKKSGIIVEIGECLRTVEEQDALYAQGRTKPGPIVTNAKGSSYSSQHQWGIAFDFHLRMDIDGDGSVSDDAFNDSTGMFGRAAAVAKKLGLAWGGDWKSIVDKPHLYLADWGSTTTQLRQQYGTPDKFRATWKPKDCYEGFALAVDGKRWWYQYKDGSFAKAGWYWLTEQTGKTSAWYLFDAEGYMLTGYRKDPSGDSFFLCPDKGIREGQCMVTDERGVLKIIGKYDFDKRRYVFN